MPNYSPDPDDHTALPDSGPRLSLLAGTELPEVTPPPLAPLTTGTVLLSNQLLNAARLANNNANTAHTEVNDDDLDEPRTDRRRAGQLQLDSTGPVIRCQSSRSNPAAQLRFFVNDQPVELRRTVENSTLSYSDGLESNVASFRLQLNDFIMAAEEDSRNLQKAGANNLKINNALQSDTKPKRASTTTTTTSSTPRPTKPDANANVQFDDEKNLPMKKEDFKVKAKVSLSSKADEKSKEKKRRKSKKKQQNDEKNKNAAKPTSSISGADNANDDYYSESSKLDEPDDDQLQTIAVSSALPLAEDKTNAHRKLVEQHHQQNTASTNPLNSIDNLSNYVQPANVTATTGAPLERLKRATAAAAAAAGSNGPSSALLKQEQRVRPQSFAGDANSNNNQNLNTVYSNYIKIKCTSLVPAVGYEMTSEFTVPLTLLVPAHQLIDAAAAAAALRQQQQANGRFQNPQDDGSPSGNTNSRGRQQSEASLFGAPRVFKNGGSLQAPRAVLIDRLAQASAPPTHSLAAQSGNDTSSSSGRKPTPKKGSSRVKAVDEQRAKYLDEIAKQGRPGEFQIIG